LAIVNTTPLHFYSAFIIMVVVILGVGLSQKILKKAIRESKLDKEVIQRLTDVVYYAGMHFFPEDVTLLDKTLKNKYKECYK